MTCGVTVPNTAELLALVVDDDTVSRLVLCHQLRSRGFTVVEATNVADAKARVAERSFTIIFSDYSMPDGTGLDVAAARAQHASTAPVILVTGIAEFADETTTSNANVQGHLTKPVTTIALVSCLESLDLA